jgi:O-antigen/teichoic acid export membrane protein
MVGRTPPGYLGRMSSPGRPGETRDERADRNLVDLLQELRVATLGVQVLFGFLLGLPFTSRFSGLQPWQRWLYLAVMMLSSVSVVLLVAPVAYHRLLFRRHQLEHLIRAANVMAVCGLAAVALAVACAVLLVTSYVEPGLPAVVLTVVIAALFGTFWFALPIARRERVGAPPQPSDQQP